MGSKSRMIIKLRQSPQFCAMERWMEGRGLAFTVNSPPGKGHPFLLIDTPAGQVRHVIACTPMGRGNVDAALARLRRAVGDI